MRSSPSSVGSTPSSSSTTATSPRWTPMARRAPARSSARSTLRARLPSAWWCSARVPETAMRARQSP
eukprot:9793640-Alexandrium_andersonii.AAC.1